MKSKMTQIIKQKEAKKTSDHTFAISGIVERIKKRDGRIVEFDILKIRNAAHKALVTTREGGSEEAEKIADKVYSDLFQEGMEVNGFTPDVEGIQDLVEKHFITSDFIKSARAYILYRQEHADLRDKKKEEILVAGELKVKKRNGLVVKFDSKKIEESLQDYFRGYKYIGVKRHIPEIVGEVKKNLFALMSTSEISELVVLSLRARIEKDPLFSNLAARVVVNELYKEVLGKDEFSKGFEKKYRETFKKVVAKGVGQGRLDKRLLNFDIKKISRALKPKRDTLLKYLGIETLRDRYLLKDSEQNFLEVPQYFWMRVAMGLAVDEKDQEDKAIEFYNVLSQLLFVSSSPTLFNSATAFPQLSSCYLNTVGDDLDSIFKTYSDNAQLSKYSGGIGTDWSNIRSTGALIKTTKISSQGVIPFLKIADSTTSAISRSGRRRGATVAYLETWHFDIESFLELRKNTGDDRRRTHDMNTANWIPDLFMKRVVADKSWTLFSPEEVSDLHHLYGKKFEKRFIEYEKKASEGKIKLYKRIRARTLWRKMLTMLYETGHPWITFKDPSNIKSPQNHVGVVHSSNLCTEITLNTSKDETAVCNLGSINLARHLKENGRIDKKLLRKTITTAMRMLDNVIGINFYPIKEAKNSNLKHRPVGLGVMGTQDVFFANKTPFDSKKAVSFSDEIMEYISYWVILSSSKLAKERGVYDTYKGSKWDKGIFPFDTVALLEKERKEKVVVNRKNKMNWKRVKDHVKKFGMRNSNCMAIAPTATISNISGCFPSIEPMYKNIYVKSNISGEFTIINEKLVDDLKSIGLWDEEMLSELKRYDGDITNITRIPEKLRKVYKEAFAIHPEWLLTHAAVRTKWIDQSQSLNIFINTTSGKILSDIYISAWKKGLKTTYYLRTLGASAIEKSTISLNGKGKNGELKKLFVPAITTLSCLLDEECEACQ